jgi:hypothetical protein
MLALAALQAPILAQESSSNTGLLITACVLAAIFGGTVLFIVLKYIGVL